MTTRAERPGPGVDVRQAHYQESKERIHRALLNRLGSLLDLSAHTVNGKTLGENIAGVAVNNDEVIRPLDKPLVQSGSLAVLRGNLAPDGAVTAVHGRTIVVSRYLW